jgi:hypothetical protein
MSFTFPFPSPASIPSPDGLPECELYRAYVCPVCGHPTMEHYAEMEITCSHKEMWRRYKPRTADLYQYNSPYPEAITTMLDEIEEIQCPCHISPFSSEYEVLYERQNDYMREAKWRRTLRLCETEL